MTIYLCDHCKNKVHTVTSRNGVMVSFRLCSSEYGDGIPTIDIIKWNDKATLDYDLIHVKCLNGHLANLLRRAKIVKGKS